MHSNESGKRFIHKHFSHIYIERQAFEYPDTELVLSRFPHAVRITINNYKEVFNRPNQRFQLQKSSMKLILAVKKDRFLYEGSEQVQNFDHSHVYYNSLILNCLYNCDYCYLQGMYPSGNIVVFVNHEDFVAATKEKLRSNPMYLCISYDTDLLAFENIVPFCSRWIKLASEEPDITIEIRTKSANYKSISHLKPVNNIILAWTVSPQPVIESYEKDTPSLQSRLNAIGAAINDGWKVRLCFDPVIRTERWREDYTQCIEIVMRTLPAHQLHDISVGVFRMNSNYLQRIQRQRTDTPILYYPFATVTKTSTYPAAEREEMIQFILRSLQPHISNEKIFL
jgi:spore photoproduct lyase